MTHKNEHKLSVVSDWWLPPQDFAAYRQPSVRLTVKPALNEWFPSAVAQMTSGKQMGETVIVDY